MSNWKSTAKRRKKPAGTASTTKTETKATDKKTPLWEDFDRDGNGRIDVDDLLIGMRECFQWVFSWRGAMLVSGGFTFLAALVNIASWGAVFSSLGPAAIGAATLTWGVFQTVELMPALDDLNLKSSLASLIRMQRKPLELPVVNEELNPEARTKYKRYKNRAKNQDIGFEFLRYAAYGIELAILVGGSGILSPTGINWASALLAVIGAVGVEMGLRLTNACGERLLGDDEREFMQSILNSAKRTSATVEGETSKA